MSLLLLFHGTGAAAPVVETPADTHDGGYSREEYDRLLRDEFGIVMKNRIKFVD